MKILVSLIMAVRFRTSRVLKPRRSETFLLSATMKNINNGDRFIVSYYDFNIDEILGMLEKGQISMTELQNFVMNSPYAFECFRGDACGFFIDGLDLNDGCYIDISIDPDDPVGLLVYLKINGEMEPPFDTPH